MKTIISTCFLFRQFCHQLIRGIGICAGFNRIYFYTQLTFDIFNSFVYVVIIQKDIGVVHRINQWSGKAVTIQGPVTVRCPGQPATVGHYV